MIRIVIIVSSLRRAGPEIVVQNLVRNIDRSIFDIQIIKLMDDEPSRSITSEFVQDEITIHELHSSKLKIELFPIHIIRRIRAILKKINPDIVHTHGYQACSIGARLSKQYKVIETLHCIAKEDFLSSKGFILGRYMLYRYLKSLNKIQAVAAISETVRKYYEKKLNNVYIRRVYNGVSLKTVEVSKNDICTRLGISNTSKIFLVIGALSQRKDPITIIKAFKKAFLNSNQNVYLLFIGKGDLKERCLKLIGDDQRIKLLGWKPNVADYLAISDYTISASHSEGFGLNFIESISAGVPVIGSNILPFMEFYDVFPDLKSLSFGVGNVDELANILKKSVNNKFNIIQYSQKAMNMFSAKTMAKNYESLYKYLIDKD